MPDQTATDAAAEIRAAIKDRLKTAGVEDHTKVHPGVVLGAAVQATAVLLATKDTVIAQLRDRINAAAEIAESYSGHAEIERILDALEGRDGDE